MTIFNMLIATFFLILAVYLIFKRGITVFEPWEKASPRRLLVTIAPKPGSLVHRLLKCGALHLPLRLQAVQNAEEVRDLQQSQHILSRNIWILEENGE